MQAARKRPRFEQPAARAGPAARCEAAAAARCRCEAAERRLRSLAGKAARFHRRQKTRGQTDLRRSERACARCTTPGRTAHLRPARSGGNGSTEWFQRRATAIVPANSGLCASRTASGRISLEELHRGPLPLEDWGFGSSSGGRSAPHTRRLGLAARPRGMVIAVRARPGKNRRGGHGRWRARPNGTSQGTPGACWPRSTPCRPAPLAHNSAAAAPDPRRGSAAPRGSASAAQQLVACHHGARLPHVRVQIPGGGRRGHGPGARHAAAPPAADPRPHSARSSLPMQPARRRRSLPPLWRAAALSSLRCRARR